MNGKWLVGCLFLVFYLCPVFAAPDDTTIWQGTYYQAEPAQRYVNQAYCDEHTPGRFVHTVKGALTYPIITNRGIILDQATFHVRAINDFYFMQGELRARGMSRGKVWEDRIHYYLFKRGQRGVTKGMWSTNECKGRYQGIVLKNGDFKPIKPHQT
ncbi:hypothetical protein DIZ81_04825 [Legionella taurinensis]|uniref:Uncharacterized protein n=1 Tax=Legionella taurinensis TaxID=70611 RepID=A0A3A5LFG2_9GAMM|nr:hypothetical protein [Legionella taurinensis]MDX1836995.1 hypothetical protein [Legionella taurinensis]PUT41402.1 hypothetical protein DB744_04825 [Legionella taurinensis]PUT42641.1 hypothetical protein DB746_07160 [Legionella taurinensis]PUT46669.1 hypothetical protein DB743_04560 [Legionella taurinensis]PUT47318.1 hypothetical protein DB745_08240 [Legionella taurinensis]